MHICIYAHICVCTCVGVYVYKHRNLVTRLAHVRAAPFCSPDRLEPGRNVPSSLAFTRHSFTSRLLCTNQPSFHPPPAHLHCPP